MIIVIDASAILAVLLHEPERVRLIAATASGVLITPASTPCEIGNGLVAGLRRKRLTPEDAGAAWASYEDIPLRLVEVDILRAIHSAVKYGLYAYDAFVLEAALTRGAPLLTLDRPLAVAAKRAGVSLLEI